MISDVLMHRIKQRCDYLSVNTNKQPSINSASYARYWIVTLQAIGDPYCQAVSVSVCLSAARLVRYRQRPA